MPHPHNDETAIATALEPLASMLAADGFELGLDAADHSLTVKVLPTTAACAGCLVSAEIIERIVRDQLAGTGVNVEELVVDVVLPTTN